MDAQALRGAKLYDDGQSAEAERVYQDILKQHPEHVGSLVGLAKILLDRDDLDGAGAAIERALKANPQSIPALQEKIALLLARDQAAEAVRLAENGDAAEAEAALKRALELQRALRLQPDRGEAHEELAEALLAARRPAEARRHAEEAQRQGRDVRALLQQIARAQTP